MKHTTLIIVLTLIALTGCEKKPEEPFVPDPVIKPSSTLPPGHPPITPNNATMTPSDRTDVALTQKATVVSAIDVPQFTYLEVKQDNQTRWLAASTIAVKKGDVIQFDNGATMKDFNSKTLNRTFPSITFVNRVAIAKGE